MYFTLAVFLFFLKSGSFVLLLLNVELLVILLSVFLYFSMSLKIFFMYFLFMGVLGAVYGLSLLIFFIRFFGHDKVFNFFW